jgi:hypothetical protein
VICFRCGNPGHFVKQCILLATKGQCDPSIARCGQCGKIHPSMCRWGTARSCFNCVQVGHYARNGPQVVSKGQGTQASNDQSKPIAPAKVHTLTPMNTRTDGSAANVANAALGTTL